MERTFQESTESRELGSRRLKTVSVQPVVFLVRGFLREEVPAGGLGLRLVRSTLGSGFSWFQIREGPTHDQARMIQPHSWW